MGFGGSSLLLGRLSNLVFDLYQNIKPRHANSGAPIVVVDIDEASIRELGQWPWPRSEIARDRRPPARTRRRRDRFDVVFSEPDRTSFGTAAETLVTRRRDRQSAPKCARQRRDACRLLWPRAALTAGFVLTNETDAAPPPAKAGFAFAGADPQSFLHDVSRRPRQPPDLNEAAAGFGFFSFPPSRDGIVRIVPLVAREPRKTLSGALDRGAARRRKAQARS